MQAPSRRIWLYPVGSAVRQHVLEIVVLGDPDNIAPLVTEMRSRLEQWPGFNSVRPLVMGTQQVGFTAVLSNLATHADPIAEAMLALRVFTRIEWSATIGAGMVGAW